MITQKFGAGLPKEAWLDPDGYALGNGELASLLVDRGAEPPVKYLEVQREKNLKIPPPSSSIREVPCYLIMLLYITLKIVFYY